MTQERSGLAKSLILKDTKKVVILLFYSCFCTTIQRPPKVNFYYVTQVEWIRIYPEFKRFSIRTKGELISDLILRLLDLRALLISSGYWKKRAVCNTPPLVNKENDCLISLTLKLSAPSQSFVLSEEVLSLFLNLTTCNEVKFFSEIVVLEFQNKNMSTSSFHSFPIFNFQICCL